MAAATIGAGCARQAHREPPPATIGVAPAPPAEGSVKPGVVDGPNPSGRSTMTPTAGARTAVQSLPGTAVLPEFINISLAGLPTVEAQAAVPNLAADGPTAAPPNRQVIIDGCPSVILAVFGDAAPAACAIAWCESKWDAWAVGDHGASVGLFQIGPRWWQHLVPGEDLMDPAVNTRAAWLISKGGMDWSAWTCRYVLS